MNDTNYILTSELVGATPKKELKISVFLTGQGSNVVWPDDSGQESPDKTKRSRQRLIEAFCDADLLKIAEPKHSNGNDIRYEDDGTINIYVRYSTANIPEGQTWQRVANSLDAEMVALLNQIIADHFHVVRHMRINSGLWPPTTTPAEPKEGV